MSCNCAVEVDRQLAERGFRLISATIITKELSLHTIPTTVAIERAAEKSRKPVPKLHAPFCPFCGRRYGPVTLAALDLDE
ncbi:hypothetical protein [uncultured Lamprocystis sp.]|jgi:hypothetical protein|uniref:hypothetical protein n=1 Tax=uncultured Lamprocystis sp. TaxID=543132 RepID=UPI0025FBE695|nr:hypothetical protein [uncultured Lamprocystis sp.]